MQRYVLTIAVMCWSRWRCFCGCCNFNQARAEDRKVYKSLRALHAVRRETNYFESLLVFRESNKVQ